MSEETTEHDLQVSIKAHQASKISDDQILQVFGKLADMVLIHRGWQFGHHDGVVAEAADLCLVKLPRYDSNKGLALNFFVTTIACYLIQARRMQTNFWKLAGSKV